MTTVEAISRLAGGVSIALGLLAFMILRTPLRDLPKDITHGATEMARRLNARAWGLIALSALVYRPLHAGWLLSHPAPPWLSRLGDLAAASMAAAAFILLLAARGFARGFSLKRVARGAMVNVTLVLVMTGAAWLTQ